MASRVEIQYNYTSLMINFIKGNVQVGQLDMERRALLAATRQLKQANTPIL